MSNHAVLQTNLPGAVPVTRGKVRDIYDLGDRLVIAATDRISAFDYVNTIGIPDKGRLLTQMSAWWFSQIEDIIPNHLVSTKLEDFPGPFQEHRDQFEGRCMLVRRCSMLPVEFVVRGYLAGSGWKEYRRTGTVCGAPLPEGLQQGSRLPEPIFTPATKASDGHDENISAERAKAVAGAGLVEKAADASLRIYERGRGIAESKGVILADSKFEFGLHDGELVVADEVLTPDSSRFWPVDGYEPGRSQPSYDKQFVRDWLEQSGWDKNSPPPELPAEIVEKTREKYVEAYRKLTGRTDF